VAIFWLLMAVIGVVFGLVLFLITFALIFAGVVVGGGLGYGLYALSDSWFLAMIAGLPIFLVIRARGRWRIEMWRGVRDKPQLNPYQPLEPIMWL